MLLIDKASEKNCRMLRHGPDVFHEALKWVPKGEHRFRVTDGCGLTYDLVYKENNAILSEVHEIVKRASQIFLPPYLSYDETDSARISLDLFEGYDEVVFEEANEYTVVAASILLRETDKKLIFTDDRILWFLPSSDRLQIRAAGRKKENTFVCCRERGNVGPALTGDESVMSAEALFHNVFIWQWITDRPLSDVKYACVSVLKTEGIGAILDHYMRMKQIFAKEGIRTYLRRGCTRYDDDMLRRLFRIEDEPKDADETNTIDLRDFLPMRLSTLFYRSETRITREMLNPTFLNQINEYYDAVFGKEKVLGVLIRGTDYINLKLDGVRAQATCEEMIPVIDEWLQTDGYDRIFLATEDKDVLDKMFAYYGKKLAAISQKRYSVNDFQKGQFLSDVEKAADVEDTTVNYYYALVILSKCDAFMVSGQCNGWDVVRDLNGGSFSRTLKMGGGWKAS